MRWKWVMLPVLAFVVGAIVALLPVYGQSTATAPAYRGPATTNAYRPVAARRAGTATAAATFPAERVEGISDVVRRGLRVPAYYTKILVHRGLPIVGSDKVSDYAFLECAYTIDHMLKDSPPAVMEALVKNRVQVGILSVVEYTMDLPNSNNAGRNPTVADLAFQDRRSRGLGGQRFATCAEENLLNLRGDPYASENITIHEFSHTIASNMNAAVPGWFGRLQEAFRQAAAAGLYANTYAGQNEQEYWAEGTQSWFDCARQNDRSVHAGVWTRAQMKAYDPALAALLMEVYGDGDWRYVKTTANARVRADGAVLMRTPAEMEHLAGLDAVRNAFPVFSFERSPRIMAAAATRAAASRAATGAGE